MEEVERGQRALEFLMNALRLRGGFGAEQFEKRTGIAFGDIQERLECLSSRRLLALNGGRVRATSKGYRLLDGILGEFA